VISVIGYEGRRHPGSSVNWGIAALAEGVEWIVNAATRRRTPYSELSYLIDEGHLTPLAKPIVALPVPRADSGPPRLGNRRRRRGRAGGSRPWTNVFVPPLLEGQFQAEGTEALFVKRAALHRLPSTSS
jgi:hypothetical protein